MIDIASCFKILCAGTFVYLLSISTVIAQEKFGPFVNTDKTISQLISEGFEIKGASFSGGIGILLQKKNTLYYCFTGKDSSKSKCLILDEK